MQSNISTEESVARVHTGIDERSRGDVLLRVKEEQTIVKYSDETDDTLELWASDR